MGNQHSVRVPNHRNRHELKLLAFDQDYAGLELSRVDPGLVECLLQSQSDVRVQVLLYSWNHE
jgi:hypothetical protein